MNSIIWLFLVVAAILMWSSTCLLYKAGAHDVNEEHICMKFSVCIGIVFYVISLVYLIIREENFTIFESAVKYWPMTIFGIVYVIVNTISFKGYVYNESMVESPVEGISGGVSTILLSLARKWERFTGCSSRVWSSHATNKPSCSLSRETGYCFLPTALPRLTT